MKIKATLYDKQGNSTTRIENLRWLLNLISNFIKNDTTIQITSPGGTIVVRKEQ